MKDFEEKLESNETVIPDAGVAKFNDGTYWLIKFALESNSITGMDEIAAYVSEISKDDLDDIEIINTLDDNSILFVKIQYEFQFDEDNGVMEMELSRLVTLTDGITGESITSQEVMVKSPEDLIPIYLDVLNGL